MTESHGTPQEKIGQYWQYIFKHPNSNVEPGYNAAVFYSFTEVDARKQYKEHFGVDAGELIERSPW